MNDQPTLDTRSANGLDAPFIAVTKLLSTYFDGLYESDSAKLAEALHPQAHYVSVTDGTLLYRQRDEYLSIVAQRPSPAGRGETRRDRILSIEFAGPVTAFARVECAIGAKFFTDLLTLVYVDQRWCIISKVFHYELQ